MMIITFTILLISFTILQFSLIFLQFSLTLTLNPLSCAVTLLSRYILCFYHSDKVYGVFSSMVNSVAMCSFLISNKICQAWLTENVIIF